MNAIRCIKCRSTLISLRSMSNGIPIDEALQKMTQIFNDLRAIVYKQDEHIQFLETKALNLSMFYVAFQLVIFVFISKPSAHQCKNWWKHLCLSLSIAVVFWLNFATTTIKYVRMKFEQDRNYIDLGENYIHMTYLERKIRDKDGAEMVEFDGLPKVYVANEPDMFATYQRRAHIGITALALIVFTVVVLDTCRSFVCADVA